VWAAPFTAAPSINSSALGNVMAETQKMFPAYKYGENLFIMAYGELVRLQRTHHGC
jgi:hypothetical protein